MQKANSFRVFISYSRRDLDQADALVEALENDGFDVFIDRRDLPFGEKWQPELADFVRQSDAIIWLVSRASVMSDWCRWELSEMTRLGKRLIPIMIDHVDYAMLPEQIGEIQIIPSEGLFDQHRDFSRLVEALLTDRQWVKEHTRMTDRAFVWNQRGRQPSLLLTGNALQAAEAWRASRPEAAPRITDEIAEFLAQSRLTAVRRTRQAIGLAVAVLLAVVGLSVYAYIQYGVAEKKRAEAERAAVEATRQRMAAAKHRQLAETQRLLLSPGAIAEIRLGNRDAPVMIVEYCAVFAPFCLLHHRDVLPVLKEKYIDTGRVFYIYRDLPTREPEIQAHMLARCACSAERFNIIDTLYKADRNIPESERLFAVAQKHGFTRETYEKCLADQQLRADVVELKDGMRRLNIKAVPTFFINSEPEVGGRPVAFFDQKISDLLNQRAEGKPPAPVTR